MAVPVTDMIVSTAEDGVVAETTSIKDPNLAMAQSGVNNVLLEIISRFSGATYAGVATPETNPGTPLLKVFYLTTTAGEYANFGNLTVKSGKLTVLLYNGSTWEKQELDLPASGGGSTVNDVKDLSDKVNSVIEKVFDYQNSTPILDYFENVNLEDESAFTPLYERSIFSGYGFGIGKVESSFRYLYTKFKAADWNDNVTPVTKVLVQIRDTDKNGSILYSKIFDIDAVQAGQSSDLTIDLGEDLSFSQSLFLIIRLNALGSLMKCATSTNATDVQAVYFINGNITESTIGTDASPVGETYSSLFFILYESAEFAFRLKEDQIEDIANRLPANIKQVDISLPDKIYAVVGDTLQVFFRGIIKAVDPYRYDILVSCAKGKQLRRYFEYTPSASDVGTTTLSISVKDDNLLVLAEKSCELVTVAAPVSPANSLNIACFGDSLTTSGDWCAEVDRRLTGAGGDPVGNSLTNIHFVGSKKKGTTGYFGAGGWKWESYTQAPSEPFYRFEVTGVNSLAIGTVYEANGNTFTIAEVNVTAGSGSILCAVPSLEPAPLESGVLTKRAGAGDSTITYSSASPDLQNPLWDAANNKMSFIPYANEFADGKIDVVYTLLTWNKQTPGRSDFSAVIDQIKIFADTLHSEFPGAKLKILGIQIPSVTGGMGYSYGATGTSYADGYGMVVTALNQNDAYQEFANSPGYSDFVEFVNISSQFDSEYNMPLTQKKVNSRNTEIESVGSNGVHPTVNGYYQIADIVYRNFVANFCQNE